FNHHVHDVRIAVRDLDVHAALVRLGEAAAFDLAPRVAAVRRLPERGAWPAALQVVRTAHAFPARRVQRIRVARIHRDVDEAGLVAYEFAQLPRLAAVGGLVEAALGIRRPCRADGGDVDDVGIRRVDNDASDVLRLLEAERLPGESTVGGLVHAESGR